MSRTIRVLATALAPLLALPGVASASAPDSPAQGTDYRVDCSATGGHPDGPVFTTLAEVNAHVFSPGDTISFRRGTTCVGTLEPKGSGTAAAPIQVGAYGRGAPPVLDGAGAPNVIHLYNQEYWEIRDLDITDAANPGGNRRGVLIELKDYGVGHHYVLQDLTIHDVLGDDTKDQTGSAGILFAVNGDAVPTSFDDVAVEDNAVRHVDREGIFFASSWSHRPEVGDPVGPAWTPSTHVVVRRNHLSDIGGDGIVMTVTDHALVERNVLKGFQLRSGGYNAGMWPYNADHTLFQFNDTSGGGSTLDGMAYDVDQGAIGTVFQYNYSHDNAGGFFLICNANGVVKDAVIRYNISQNDSYRGFETCTAGGIEGASVYNNTVYVGPGVSQVAVNENNTLDRRIAFADNIFTADGGTMTFNVKSDLTTFAANLYDGIDGAPADAAAIRSSAQLVAPGTATDAAHADGYELRAGSPALDSGVTIADNGGRDYFGNPVPAGRAPNRGAYAGPGVR